MTRIKYEINLNSKKVQWFLRRRGLKRIQEIKRFKSLGEAQVYQELLQKIEENRQLEIQRRIEEAERQAREEAEAEARALLEAEQAAMSERTKEASKQASEALASGAGGDTAQKS